MTQDEIIEMARKAGLVDWESSAYRNELQAFAKLVAAKECNFCSRCGKRTADLTTIHTCTPPRGQA